MHKMVPSSGVRMVALLVVMLAYPQSFAMKQAPSAICLSSKCWLYACHASSLQMSKTTVKCLLQGRHTDPLLEWSAYFITMSICIKHKHSSFKSVYTPALWRQWYRIANPSLVLHTPGSSWAGKRFNHYQHQSLFLIIIITIDHYYH